MVKKVIGSLLVISTILLVLSTPLYAEELKVEEVECDYAKRPEVTEQGGGGITGESVGGEEVNVVEVEEKATTAGEDPLTERASGNVALDFYENMKVDEAEKTSLYSVEYIHDARFNGVTIRNGIDVSHFQGNIDWTLVHNAGIEFAIIRVGYRGYGTGNLAEDSKYLQNIRGAIDAGIKVGVYIFSQAITEAEAAEEANYIIDRIGGNNITLPVVIDYEYTQDKSGRLVAAGLSKEQKTAICRTFCETVKSRGYTPMIYANYNMLCNDLDGNLLGTNYRIWLARYNSSANYGGNYSFWQYTDSGSVSGISTAVDRDFWYDDSAYIVSQEVADNYVQRLYVNLLGRVPSDAEIGGWRRQLENGVTAASVAVSFIDSSEFRELPLSNIDSVERIYRAILGRGADSSGMALWGNMLDNGVSCKFILKAVVESDEFSNWCVNQHMNRGIVTLTEARDVNYNITKTIVDYYKYLLDRSFDVNGLNNWCQNILYKDMDMATVVECFVNSSEFTDAGVSSGEYITRLYRGIMGREPDVEGKTKWEMAIENGMSNEYILKSFVDSQEFSDVCSSRGIKKGTILLTQPRDFNPNVTMFVVRNYTEFLERRYDVDGLNYWVDKVISGRETPATLAYQFVFSEECKNAKLSDRKFVQMLYRGCLGRSSDFSGENHWVRVLEMEEMSREQVYWEFANSVEFKNMVSSYGV